MTYDDVRAIALELPGVEEGASYGMALIEGAWTRVAPRARRVKA